MRHVPTCLPMQERENPDMLMRAPHRRRRIARESEKTMDDVMELLQQYGGMRQRMKQMSKMMQASTMNGGVCLRSIHSRPICKHSFLNDNLQMHDKYLAVVSRSLKQVALKSRRSATFAGSTKTSDRCRLLHLTDVRARHNCKRHCVHTLLTHAVRQLAVSRWESCSHISRTHINLHFSDIAMLCMNVDHVKSVDCCRHFGLACRNAKHEIHSRGDGESYGRECSSACWHGKFEPYLLAIRM